MEIKKVGVLHLDTEHSWRGGQQQAAYLLENLFLKGFHTKLICQPRSEFGKFCERKELPYKEIKMHNEADISAGYKVARICKNHKYRILHLHSAHALSIGIWAKVFFRDLILIGVRRVDFHLKNRISKKLKYNSRWMNRIVCISNGIAKVMKEDGIDPEKLITIHSGINIHKFDNDIIERNFRRDNNIPEKDIIVGTIAAFVGHKDYPNLIRAAKLVLSKNSNISFVALGSGKLEDEMKEMAKKLNISDRFHFLGFRKNIGSIIKNFSIFVMPSRWEGLGTSILDAQSVGLPVIGTKTGGIPEAVEHNVNGLIVPSADSQKLSEAIIKLAENEELRKEFSKMAMISVMKFDITETVNKNIELYKELVCEF